MIARTLNRVGTLVPRLSLWTHYCLATWFGVGFAPFAPGTMGALAALPLFWLLAYVSSWPVTVAVITVLTVAGGVSGHAVAGHRGDEDPALVVIDEVVGVLIALAFVMHAPLGFQALAWVLFRVFDITKPGIIRRLEHTRPIGVGIMLDDVCAGLLAGVLALLVYNVWP